MVTKKKPNVGLCGSKGQTFILLQDVKPKMDLDDARHLAFEILRLCGAHDAAACPTILPDDPTPIEP